MEDTVCKRAAMLLETGWRDGVQIAHLPKAVRPETRADGYRIQAALETMAGDGVAGWKIAATSEAGQAHINVDGPLAGRIFGSRVRGLGETISLQGNNMRVAELEFAFLLGQDVGPRTGGYSDDEVREMVAGLHPAIEIPASRFSDFTTVGAPALIADNSCANLFVLGPAFDDTAWHARDLTTWRLTAEIEGKGMTHGVGSNVLGDPWAALSWFVNECSEHGIALTAGQWVSTGTCLMPVPVAEGDVLVAEFGLGVTIEVVFS